MLYGFTCRNYSSYNNECIFTMEAGKKTEYDYINTIETVHGKILKSALIYGANGSGKSNMLRALRYMRELILNSVMEPRLIRINDPFKFRDVSKKEATSFEISFILDEVLYTYGFEIYNNRIKEEWLYKKEKRETLLFERKSENFSDIHLHGEFKVAEDIKKHTRKDALFLTTSGMLNIPKANEILGWFSKLNIITDKISNNMTIEYIEKNPEIKETILEYLKVADVGIDDVKYDIEHLDVDDNYKETFLDEFIETNNNFSVTDIGTKTKKVDINTKHNIYSEDREIIDEVYLPFDKYQSDGTKKLFNLLGPILKSLIEGEILIIDEIDSKLHPSIIRSILAMYNSIDKNKSNGQLICNTHDVLLLNESIRRDQIWFVEKNQYRESELYSLSDFKGVRKNDSILKKYLLGVYGAIPFKKGSES